MLNTRAHDGPLMVVPKPNSSRYRNSVAYRGPTAWNILDPNIRCIENKNNFRAVKSYYWDFYRTYFIEHNINTQYMLKYGENYKNRPKKQKIQGAKYKKFKMSKMTEIDGKTGNKLFFPQNVKIPEIRKFTTNWHPCNLHSSICYTTFVG